MAYKSSSTSTVFDDSFNWKFKGLKKAESQVISETETILSPTNVGSSSIAIGNDKIITGGLEPTSPGDKGIVYVCDLDGSNYFSITASDAAANDRFGSSVAVGNGKIAVGNSNKGNNKGGAYIYDLDGDYEVIINGIDVDADLQNFGRHVKISQNKLFVSANNDVYSFDLDGTNQTSIVSNTSVNGMAVGYGKVVITNSSGIFIYDFYGNLIRSISNTNLGHVVVKSARIIVSKSRTGENNELYIYDLNGNLIKSFTQNTVPTGAMWGYFFDVSGGKIIVSAGGYRGLNGALFVYDLLDGNFIELIDPGYTSFESFGNRVAASNGIIVSSASATYIHTYEVDQTYTDFLEDVFNI